MKSFSIILVVALGAFAFALDEIRSELNNEIKVLYPRTTLKKRADVKRLASRPDVDLEENSRSVIINNNVSPDRVREDSSTVVEASPVDPSKGAEARKSRELVEKGTEDTIVQ